MAAILSRMSKSKKNGSLGDTTLEDLVGLLTTVGVLAALVLSVAIGALMVDGRDDSLDAQYRNQLIMCTFKPWWPEPNHPTDESKNFRLFVIKTLERLGFNFTVAHGGTTVDVREILERTVEHNDPFNAGAQPGTTRDMELAYYLTRSAMPMDHIAAYSLRYDLKGAMTSVSSGFGPGSVAFCSAALLGTTIIYIGLMPVQDSAELFFRLNAAHFSSDPDAHACGVLCAASTGYPQLQRKTPRATPCP